MKENLNTGGKYSIDVYNNVSLSFLMGNILFSCIEWKRNQQLRALLTILERGKKSDKLFEDMFTRYYMHFRMVKKSYIFRIVMFNLNGW